MSAPTSKKRTIREFAARSHALQAQHPVKSYWKPVIIIWLNTCIMFISWNSAQSFSTWFRYLHQKLDLNQEISCNFVGGVRAVIVMKSHDAYNVQLAVVQHPETRCYNTTLNPKVFFRIVDPYNTTLNPKVFFRIVDPYNTTLNPNLNILINK